MSANDGAPLRPHGRVASAVHPGGRSGALLAVCCSSEVLARSSHFVEYTERLCQHVLDRAPSTVEELAEQDWSYEGGTALEALQRFSAQVGESVRVQQLCRLASPEGQVWAWTHPDSRSGVLLSLQTLVAGDLLRDVAFQLAGQILVQRCGELVMGEFGPAMHFDPEALGALPWARRPEHSVAEELELALGEGSRLLGYARFEVG